MHSVQLSFSVSKSDLRAKPRLVAGRGQTRSLTQLAAGVNKKHGVTGAGKYWLLRPSGSRLCCSCQARTEVGQRTADAFHSLLRHTAGLGQ